MESLVSFFFFNDTATTEIYTLSLHDALPISADLERAGEVAGIAIAANRAFVPRFEPRRFHVCVLRVRELHLQALRSKPGLDLGGDARRPGVEHDARRLRQRHEVGPGGGGGASRGEKTRRECGMLNAKCGMYRRASKPGPFIPHSALRIPHLFQCECSAVPGACVGDVSRAALPCWCSVESASSPASWLCPARRSSISCSIVRIGTPAACSNTILPPTTPVHVTSTRPTTARPRSTHSSTAVVRNRRHSRHTSSTVNRLIVTRPSVSCFSISSWMPSPCSMTSSACNPAITASQPPSTPAHRVQIAAHLSDSRLNAQAARSNSTPTVSRAAGRSFKAACSRGQS